MRQDLLFTATDLCSAYRPTRHTIPTGYFNKLQQSFSVERASADRPSREVVRLLYTRA